MYDINIIYKDKTIRLFGISCGHFTKRIRFIYPSTTFKSFGEYIVTI